MESDTHDTGTGLSVTTGQKLRQARELKGIPLEAASAATKIGKNYLAALEDDRHNEFASTAYLKGFIKNYATYLELDPDDLLKFPEAATPPENPSRGGEAPDKRLEKRRRLWQKMVLPLFLLAAIIITAFFYTPGGGPDVRTTSPVPPPPEKPVMKPVSSVAATAPVPALSAPVTKPDTTQIQAQTGLLVKMRVLKNGTMTVSIDDTSPQPYDLSTGDHIEWKADRSITMDLSDAGGVELLMNGKPLKLTAPAGKPASIVIDPNGIRQ